MKKDVRSMKLTMQLKSRSYDIILKAGCLANLHQFTNVQHRKVFVLTDSGVPAAYAQTVAAQCPEATVYTIPQGEGSKCLKVYGQVLQAMLGPDARVETASIDAVLAAWDAPGTPQAAPHGGYVANIQGNLAISANKRGVRLEPMAAFRARRRK